jgi:asparagine synthase (glutamine-hydrolysing)
MTSSAPRIVRALPLGPLERASGLALGADRDGAPSRRTDQAPRQALESALLPALTSGRCYVSFSGGRDSSAVLATAVSAARRHGAPDPIPITLRFPDVASTDETDWQERVVDHLRLHRWEIISIGDELDLLGDLAQRALRRHGVLWPPNSHFHEPMFQRAAGGTLLTGFDGDGLFGTWRWARAQAVLHRRVTPEPRDLGRVGLALAPLPVRRRQVTTVYAIAAPWLRPEAQRAVTRLAKERMAAEPRRWDRRIADYRRSRHLRLATHSLGALGQARGVSVVHPFLDPDFLAALAHAGGGAGYGDRTATMQTMFGDVLPPELVGRRTKGEFGRAIWRSRARAFAEDWDGEGIDTDLVDPDRLREAWLAPNPYFGSSTLLHLAWFNTRS